MQSGDDRFVGATPPVRHPRAWFRATSIVTVMAMAIALVVTIGETATAQAAAAAAPGRKQATPQPSNRRPATLTVTLRHEAPPSPQVGRERAEQRLRQLFAARQTGLQKQYLR